MRTGKATHCWRAAVLIVAVGCSSDAAGSASTLRDAMPPAADPSPTDGAMFTPRSAGREPDAGTRAMGASGQHNAPTGPADAGATNTRGDDAGSPEPPPDPDAAEIKPQAGLRITLPSGRLTGFQVSTVRAFLGIPYGKVPQRFMPSERAEAWTGMLDATRYGSDCPQANNGLTSHGQVDENCLTLDVYTPTNIDTKLPVMVFIHGGAFVAGATSQYDATQLAKTAMVVVIMNYRLGPLGFLSHPALDAARPDAPSGSDGIRDQQLALHWVRDNIGAFNGDRTRLSVFGESAGAISACIHWVSPKSRGLAARYILESGTCTIDGPGVQTKAAANKLGMQLADALCPGEMDPIACLRAKPAADLVTWGGDTGLWGPLWEPTIEGAHGVLPDFPERLADSADSLVPLIVGTNKNEWGFFEQVAGSIAPKSVAELVSTISKAFGAHADSVQMHYNTTDDADANNVWIRLITDMSFRCPSRTLARLADRQGTSAWLYSFEQGPALHAYEIDYVFGVDWVSKANKLEAPSATLTGLVQRYWTRFAATGDPNGGSDSLWPRYQTATDEHMVLVDPPRTGTGLASAECDFWGSYWRQGGTVELP